MGKRGGGGGKGGEKKGERKELFVLSFFQMD